MSQNLSNYTGVFLITLSAIIAWIFVYMIERGKKQLDKEKKHNKHINNNKRFFIDKFGLAFELDHMNNKIISYSYDLKKPNQEIIANGVVLNVNSEIAVELEQFFGIDLHEYGVKTLDENIEI